ncbi:MAG: DUF11 domain-containing protein [Propionibacteriaceae bacterium]|nr:DUF11 domain-containing protein [Propionibacteriaceae bacterium]
MTADDIAAGHVTNSGTITATFATGAKLPVDAEKTVNFDRIEGLTVAKTSDATALVQAGQEIVFNFAVINTGNVTLTGLTIDESTFAGVAYIAKLDCPETTVAPGGTVTCTGTYTVQQSDIDAKTLTNTATAVAKGPDGATVRSLPSSVTITGNYSTDVGLTKDGTPKWTGDRPMAGDSIEYTITATNAGVMTEHNIKVVDPLIPTGLVCDDSPDATDALIETLAPKASVDCKGTYVLTQADIDTGEVSNTAWWERDVPTPPIKPKVVPVDQSGALTLVKSGTLQSTGTDPKPGDTVKYTFVVTNTGNVTIRNVGISEDAFSGTGRWVSPVSCPVTSINPAVAGVAVEKQTNFVTCTGTYALSQADIDAGQIVNTAHAEANGPPRVGRVVSPPSNATVPLAQRSAVTFDKSVPEGTKLVSVDQKIVYTFTVTNTGNTTVSDISVEETAFSGAPAPAIVCPPGVGTLVPKASLECTATYVVTQADIDAGKLHNAAIVHAKDPGGKSVDTPDEITIPTATDRLPAVTITKVATPNWDLDTLPEDYRIDYTITLENLGPVTATKAQLSDPLLNNDLVCDGVPLPDDFTLAVGQVMVCTGTYTVVPSDFKSGTVKNTATVTYQGPDGDQSEASKTVKTDLPPYDLSMVKTVVTEGVPKAGDTVTFEFLVTNTGEVPVKHVVISEIAFSGTMANLSVPYCPDPVPPLKQWQTTTCWADYTVTQADVDRGFLRNEAIAIWALDPAVDPGVEKLTTPSTALYDWPGLTVSKVGTPNWAAGTYPQPGDTIRYDFTITNSGRTDLSNVVIDDELIPQSAITCAGGSVPPLESLAKGATVTCTGTYALTQANIDAGGVINTVKVTAKDPKGHPVEKQTQAPPVVTKRHWATDLVKTADKTSAGLGDVITYTYAITNTGNVTATGVAFKETEFTGKGTAPDPKTAVCTVNGTTVSLATLALPVGQTVTCTLTYTVVAADVAPGNGETVRLLTNKATVTSDTPVLGQNPKSSSTADVKLTVRPGILVKTGGSVATETGGLAGVLAGLVLMTAGVAVIVVRRRRRS